jgi:hypothetical protein
VHDVLFAYENIVDVVVFLCHAAQLADTPIIIPRPRQNWDDNKGDGQASDEAVLPLLPVL